MHYIVYIIYSAANDKYYIGHTENMDIRLEQHKIRKRLGATDWVVKYTERYAARSEAMKREMEIKSKKRRSYIEALISSSG